MGTAPFDCPNDDKVNDHATKMARAMWRGDANIEDQLSAALSLLSGLQILGYDGATTAFVRVLSEADDLLSRRAAALALGGLPDQDAQKALERAKLDAHPTVVEAAEHALAQCQQQFRQ